MRAMLVAALLGCVGAGCEAEPEAPPQAVGPLGAARAGADVGAQRARSDQGVPARGRIVGGDGPAGALVGGGGRGGGGDTGRFPRQRGRPVMTGDEAAQAAKGIAQARLAGDSPCAQAYEALDLFRTEVQEKTPWVPARAPRRDRFMEGCLALPRPLQQCMVPSYLRAHEAECERVRTAWPSLAGAPGAGEEEG